MASKNDAKRRRPRGFAGVLPYLLDLIVPLAAYYSLTAAGLTPFWALVTGGGATAALALATTVRRGRIDKLGVLVILEIALGLTLDLTVRSARLTLARGSLFILLAGAWVLATAFTDRPAAMDATKAFAAKKGGRKGIDAFEWLAAHSAPFMRVQRRLTCVWSITFIAYGAGRVVLVYSVSISQAVWLDAFPGIAAFLICMAASAHAGKKLETMVYARMDEMDTAPQPAHGQALTQDLRPEAPDPARSFLDR